MGAMKNINAKILKENAHGKWAGILSQCGVDAVYLQKNKHVACPRCREGKDRYAFKDDNYAVNAVAICNQCGAMSGIDIMQTLEPDFRRALIQIDSVMNSGNSDSTYTPAPVTNTATTPPAPHKIDTKKLERYKKAMRFSGHTPKKQGIDYLAERGITFKNPNQKLDFIRYGAGYYLDRFIPDANNKPTYHNCLLFPLSRYGAGNTGLVRIYTGMDKVRSALARIGDDTNNLSQKPMLALKPLSGSGVWFNKNVNSHVLHIGEGVENTLSILKALKTLDGVASVIAGLIPTLEIPSHITELHVWADNDNAGLEAAYKLSDRLEKQCDVIIHVPRPDLEPKKGNDDWNDILIKEGADFIKRELNVTF